MKRQEQVNKMQEIISKAWMDEGFKKRLLADPSATLKGEGVEVPPGLEVRMVENTDKVFHLVLLQKPSNAELSDEQLDNAAGGGGLCECLCI